MLKTFLFKFGPEILTFLATPVICGSTHICKKEREKIVQSCKKKSHRPTVLETKQDSLGLGGGGGMALNAPWIHQWLCGSTVAYSTPAPCSSRHRIEAMGSIHRQGLPADTGLCRADTGALSERVPSIQWRDFVAPLQHVIVMSKAAIVVQFWHKWASEAWESPVCRLSAES